MTKFGQLVTHSNESITEIAGSDLISYNAKEAFKNQWNSLCVSATENPNLPIHTRIAPHGPTEKPQTTNHRDKHQQARQQLSAGSHAASNF